MPLKIAREPFSRSVRFFELEYDGFRSLAHCRAGEVTLVSCNGHGFASFADLADSIAAALPNTKEAILGGTRPNLRILPWSGTDVTFMQLDGAANLAITGPLTGCTVSVVRHLGVIWFFHANNERCWPSECQSWGQTDNDPKRWRSRRYPSGCQPLLL